MKQLNVLENSDSNVGSFSEERDQLGQWRAYTVSGVGFSIGFNFHMLKGFAEDQHFDLLRCTYESKEREELMTDEDLLRFGKAGQYMVTPWANMGKPPREVFVVQLRECREEWRRRNPKG